MTVAVLHSYTHVLGAGWAYFRIGWAYFRVKGGPIFGKGVLENTPIPLFGVLENTPIPLFEQILNSSPMGVLSRDYGTSADLSKTSCFKPPTAHGDPDDPTAHGDPRPKLRLNCRLLTMTC